MVYNVFFLCVRERERERKRDRKKERKRERERERERAPLYVKKVSGISVLRTMVYNVPFCGNVRLVCRKKR